MTSMSAIKVTIVSNDFLDSNTSGHVAAVSDDNKAIVVALDQEAILNGKIYREVIAKFRSGQKDGFIKISSGDRFSCSVIFIPLDATVQSNKFDTSWWRGGGAAITDIIVN